MKSLTPCTVHPHSRHELRAEARGPSGARMHPRKMLRTEVHMTSRSNIYTGLSYNVSEGGVFVSTEALLPHGTLLELEFSLPDGEEIIRTVGVVRWIREDMDTIEEGPGMGIQFMDLSERVRARLERFVEMRDSLFWED